MGGVIVKYQNAIARTLVRESEAVQSRAEQSRVTKLYQRSAMVKKLVVLGR